MTSEALFDTEPSPQPPPAGIADDSVRHLHPDHVTVQRIVAAIVTGALALVAAVGGAIFLVASDLDPWMNLAIVGAAATIVAGFGVFAQIWPPVEHRYASYRVNERGIEIRRGVVWRKTINVPRSRVQHTDVAQGPIDRQYGLATLHIYTAGTEHSQVDLHGLAHDTAMQIRDHLVTGGPDDAV